MLSLAAGTVLDADPLQVIGIAAAAGFDACGLRLDPAETSPALAQSVRTALDDHGLTLLDLEVVRLDPHHPVEMHRPLLALAAELGASWALTVVQLPDAAEHIDHLGRLDEIAAEHGVLISLEFMAFTAIRTFAEAIALAAAVPRCGVLVDALHLARAGGALADVRQHLDALSYVQLCDAPAAPPGDGSATTLADEARHHRLFPGDGELDLAGLTGITAGVVPMSVEVQSDAMSASMAPRERAVAAYRSAQAVLALSSDQPGRIVGSARGT